jgi:hypothetical protein
MRVEDESEFGCEGLNYYGMHRGCELNSIGKGGGRPWHSAPAHAHSKASERGRGRGSE